MEADKKRFYRNLKRQLKKAGRRKRRRALKEDLAENPEEAHWSEHEYGRSSTEWLNGLDRRNDGADEN